MKTYLYLFFFLLNIPLLVSAQSNTSYVVNTANSNLYGSYNTVVGPSAGNTDMTGDYNVFVGLRAGENNTTGYDNTFLGRYAGRYNTIGDNNMFVGSSTGESNTTGNNNSFVGFFAGLHNTTGDDNSFMGSSAGSNTTTGTNNVFLGSRAGLSNTTGGGNAFVGYHSGSTTTTGAQNIFLGTAAGNNNTTGSRNIMLGANSKPLSATLQNAVAIGFNATVARSNAIVLGDPTNSNIAVGIGTDSPQFPLDVRGIIRLQNNGTIKFSHLLNPNLRNGASDQFLTVNQQGETLLARHRLRIDSLHQWSDKVFLPTYQLKSLTQVEHYIQHYGHLPNVPSAQQVVNEGIDPAQMDATLLEKIEELTLYTIQLEKANREQQNVNKQQQLKFQQLAHSKQQQQVEIDELKRLVKLLVKKRI